MSSLQPERDQPLDLSSPQPLTDRDRSLISRLFRDPRAIPEVFFAYVVDYFRVNPPDFPVSQIAGVNTLAPVGAVTAYAGSTAPSGWLLCDGSAVSRTQYANLFSVISTTYGTGDGSTTFNIPDLRGRMLVGKGTHTDVDNLGDNDGSTLGNRRPKHKHTVNDPTHSHTGGRLANVGGTPFDTSTGSGWTVSSTDASSTGITVGPQTSIPGDDAPAYIVLNYIVKW